MINVVEEMLGMARHLANVITTPVAIGAFKLL